MRTEVKDFRIIIDLVKLKVPYCGLGQVAMNYGREISRQKYPKMKLIFLLPAKLIGFFGQNVNYQAASFLNKHFPLFSSSCDLWHATHQDSSFMPRWSKTPYLLTIHDLNFLYEKSEKKAQKYLKRLQNKVDRATMITAISEFSANEIRQNLDLKGKEIRVIYNGVQFDENPVMLEPDWLSSKERPFLFSLGLVVPKKNIHVLLDMMKLLPEYDLYICGQNKGAYAEELKSRIKAENIENVKMTGSITDAQKNWLYQFCAGLVFPSKHEGFGLPVIEAMYRGKPVFSSKLSSLKEIGDKYAYFWNDFEPESMAKTVRNGFSHFESHPEVSIQETQYARSFSYQKNTSSYVSLYKEILGIL